MSDDGARLFPSIRAYEALCARAGIEPEPIDVSRRRWSPGDPFVEQVKRLIADNATLQSAIDAASADFAAFVRSEQKPRRSCAFCGASRFFQAESYRSYGISDMVTPAGWQPSNVNHKFVSELAL